MCFSKDRKLNIYADACIYASWLATLYVVYEDDEYI